ncbi:MAG: hypothetical protein Q7T56_07330 [Nocardioidaceae bacterium]|nr:hypothetical protein [Nocardioidaceae bacterium]
MADEDGQLWYLKDWGLPYKNKTANELLGNDLYRAAGVLVPEVVTDETGRFHASRWVEGRPLSDLTSEELDRVRADAQDGFMVDAWLSNWDVAGTGNMRLGDDGRVWRIDAGGALFFHAMGVARRLGRHARADVESMRDPAVATEQGAKLFADVSEQALIRGAEMVASVSARTIQQLSAKAQFALDADLRLDTQVIIDRRNDIADLFGLMVED